MAKIQTGLRLSEDAYQKLKSIAESEGRSLNNLIEYILARYLKEHLEKTS